MIYKELNCSRFTFFEKWIQKWEKKDLFIMFLPTYSPHLKPIETLWRKMKHEWLKADD